MSPGKVEIEENYSQAVLKKDYCQICQFPVKLLKILTPESHFVKCRRRSTEPKKACKDGIHCMSAMESHYQIYSHEKLRKHRTELVSSLPGTSNRIKNVFQSLHGLDTKFSQVDKKRKKNQSFAELYVDLTDTHSSEEFKSSQNLTQGSRSRKNSFSKKMKSSPLTSSNSSNTSHVNTSLGKHKMSSIIDPNKTKTLPQTQKLKKTPIKRRKSVKIEKPMSENPWSIASTIRNSQTLEKRSKKNENIPLSQTNKSKKKPVVIKIEKPITENPWTITSSQLAKVRTPTKKPSIFIDLTEGEDDVIKRNKSSTSDVCDKKGSKGKNDLSKKISLPKTDQNKNVVLCNSNLPSSGKKNNADRINNDFTKNLVVKLERISPEKYPNLKTTSNLNPVKSLNHDKNNLSNLNDFSMNEGRDDPLQSTQIGEQNTLGGKPFVTPSSLDTQDSEEWSIPLCRGPGFVPFSPIIGNKSYLQSQESFEDSDAEKSEIKIEAIKFTKNGKVCVEKNAESFALGDGKDNYFVDNNDLFNVFPINEKGCGVGNHNREENEDPPDVFSINEEKSENALDTGRIQNFERVKNIGGMSSESRHDSNALDSGSDTTLDDNSDATDDEMLECSLLSGLSQYETLPVAEMSFSKSSNSDDGRDKQGKSNTKKSQNKKNTLTENFEKCISSTPGKKIRERCENLNLPRGKNKDNCFSNKECKAPLDNTCKSWVKNVNKSAKISSKCIKNDAIFPKTSSDHGPPNKRASSTKTINAKSSSMHKISSNCVKDDADLADTSSDDDSLFKRSDSPKSVQIDNCSSTRSKKALNFIENESKTTSADIKNGTKSSSNDQRSVNNGASSIHEQNMQNFSCNGSNPTLDKFTNVQNWINSSSKPKQQGDIGAMLFGMKPKVKEVQKKPEVQKEGKRRYNGGFFGGNMQRPCPFYKKVYGTDIAVDAFSYGVIDGIQFYFLSHFHADHYIGLTKKYWKHKVYCSQVTGNLVHQKIGLPKDLIVCLPMWKEIEVGNVKVTLLEANHCPGAVLFLFKLRNNKVILHTGDFRAIEEMEKYNALQGIRVDTLHLDTTYLNPDYQFPLQSQVISAAVSIATKEISKCAKTLLVVGTYLIGKERIFAAIAKAIKSSVFVAAEKYRTMQCLEDRELKTMVTREPGGAKVHVVAMRQLSVKDLKAYLLRHKEFDQLVAIKPTGWAHDNKQPSLNQIKPVISGKIKIYGLPYSEHSSFEDLRRFVKFIRPSRIIPTVNVGRKEPRDMMSRYLDKWKIGSDP